MNVREISCCTSSLSVVSSSMLVSSILLTVSPGKARRTGVQVPSASYSRTTKQFPASSAGFTVSAMTLGASYGKQTLKRHMPGHNDRFLIEQISRPDDIFSIHTSQMGQKGIGTEVNTLVSSVIRPVSTLMQGQTHAASIQADSVFTVI